MFNNKNQKYDVLGRFRVNTGNGEVEFCRVKFITTKHEEIVPASKVKTGDFEDTSIVSSPTLVKPIVKPIVKEKEVLTAPVEVATTSSTEVITDDMDTVESAIESFTIIATNPKGEEIKVNSLYLEAFCEKHKLDSDAVNAVLDGKQKQHKKWRFQQV